MCKQGHEPDPSDALLWVVTNCNFWSEKRQNAASNIYKKPKFSAFVEKLQDEAATLEYAKDKWGSKPYGIIRLTYREVVDAGYVAIFEDEDGNAAHVNITPNPGSSFSKGERSQRLCDCSDVVRPWGTPCD